MAYSDKLNGYWEEGYHFYIEIRDSEMTVREYRRKVTLQTRISYDAESLDAGRKTEIKLEDNVLSYGGSHNPMSWFEEFIYEDGELKLVEGYSFMDRHDPYTLKKVDHGPFDYFIIRDEEFLDKFQGDWVRWSPSGDYSEKYKDVLKIRGNTFSCRAGSGKFHIISYNREYDRDELYIVPWDLTESDFGSCTAFNVRPDMLTTHEMIYDMSTPLLVYAREENLDKIDVPEGAKAGYVNTMMFTPPNQPGLGNNTLMSGFMAMNQMLSDPPVPTGEPHVETDPPEEGAQSENKCKACGYEVTEEKPKFCPNCGSRLRS